MVTLKSADNALKTLYLGVVADQLNTTVNPLLTKIKQTTQDVWGKEIRKVAPFGLNGGVGAGTEDGELPESAGNNYAQFVLTLKNLYGTLSISDKAVRASESSAGAFVNLLNAEMEGLLKASSFNFGRMLFGDGSGRLCSVVSVTGTDIVVDSTRNIMEGMLIDFHSASTGVYETGVKKRIMSIDRASKTIKVTGNLPSGLGVNDFLTVQGSYNNEITGLKKIFAADGSLYGIDRATSQWMRPYIKEAQGNLTEVAMQKAIDSIEETSGSSINFIVCSSGVKRAYQDHLATYKRNIDVLDLQGGYKALSYNGIPLLSDRFIENGEMYLLNTDDFNLHQLCDWQWLESEDGKVIRQQDGRAVYTATLVKYADLICNRPSGQGKISGIVES